MKHCNKDKTLVLLALVAAVLAVGQIVKAETKKKATNWNSSSLSFFYNEQSKADLIKSLPEWNVQPMIWPTEEEITNCRGVATENQKEECVKEIRNYFKDEWIPDEIASYLLPLRKWAKPSISYSDERKADVFLCRYCMDNYMIQIMDGNWAIIITIKDITDAPPFKKDDHQNFVSNIVRTFLRGELLETQLAKQQLPNITKGGIRVGKTGWLFVTDGKFIKFEMKKRPLGPRSFPDPYEPRFSDEQKSK